MLTLDQDDVPIILELRVENGLERAVALLEGMERLTTLSSRCWNKDKDSNKRRRVMSCSSSLCKMGPCPHQKRQPMP